MQSGSLRRLDLQVLMDACVASDFRMKRASQRILLAEQHRSRAALCMRVRQQRLCPRTSARDHGRSDQHRTTGRVSKHGRVSDQLSLEAVNLRPVRVSARASVA